MQQSAGHIVIVDDDPGIIELVSDYLSLEGYKVSTAGDGNQMYEILDAEPADLIILDIRLPGQDGLTLAGQIRAKGRGESIIILSQKNDTADKVAGLEVGADDYLPKPFELRELLARVRSVLRRAGKERSGNGNGDTNNLDAGPNLTFAGFTLFPEERRLAGPDGEPVELTSGEFDLLLALAESPDRAMSRDRLLDLTSGRTSTPFDRSIDVQIGRLRRKIERDPRKPRIIKTVRSVGYLLNTA